jgi:hypothetical protein
LLQSKRKRHRKDEKNQLHFDNAKLGGGATAGLHGKLVFGATGKPVFSLLGID